MTRKFVVFLLAMMMSFSGIVSADATESSNEQMKRILAQYRAETLGNRQVTTPKAISMAKVKVAPPVQPAVETTQVVQMGNDEQDVQIPANIFVAPPKVPETVALQSKPAFLSEYWLKKHTFLELSAYAGYYQGLNSDGVKGAWWMAEGIGWYSPRDNPRNYGLGLIYKGDYGQNKAGYNWGSHALGPVLSYYQGLDETQDLNLKFRPMYRWNKGSKPNGYMLGGYAEYGKTFDDYRLSVVADGQYFKHDSFLSTGLYLEKWINPNLKVKAGLGLNVNFQEYETILGLGPSLSVKLYNRFVLGVSANIFKGGTTLGAYAGYEMNTDLKLAYEALQEAGVKPENDGRISAPIGEVKLTQDDAGSFATLPGGNEMKSTGKTVEQLLAEKEMNK